VPGRPGTVPKDGPSYSPEAGAVSFSAPVTRQSTGPKTALGQKPKSRKEQKFSALIYCLGAQGCRCHHTGRLKLADLPEWDWYDITAHPKCTECGAIGWVDTRLDWSDVINFNKGVG